ncbi:MAG: hypothetical protein G3M70_02675 [Candidatus Nitronauta litoralis]|uniref:Uncharacterized protein n=1 Tax=Candidatus Nitronauta litoralis TaxID=2705533 RepID=A0A7T0BTQ7_9BACT|nr:MAG: hypothetical protein G3M70_02675 [Candidatus Nitronauta litoralis]
MNKSLRQKLFLQVRSHRLLFCPSLGGFNDLQAEISTGEEGGGLDGAVGNSKVLAIPHNQ